MADIDPDFPAGGPDPVLQFIGEHHLRQLALAVGRIGAIGLVPVHIVELDRPEPHPVAKAGHDHDPAHRRLDAVEEHPAENEMAVMVGAKLAFEPVNGKLSRRHLRDGGVADSASIRGTVLRSSSAAARTLASSARSMRINPTSARGPNSCFRSAMARVDFAALRFSITTAAPLDRRMRATWKPAPALAPVMTKVLPARVPRWSGVQPSGPNVVSAIVMLLPARVEGACGFNLQCEIALRSVRKQAILARIIA